MTWQPEPDPVVSVLYRGDLEIAANDGYHNLGAIAFPWEFTRIEIWTSYYKPGFPPGLMEITAVLLDLADPPPDVTLIAGLGFTGPTTTGIGTEYVTEYVLGILEVQDPATPTVLRSSVEGVFPPGDESLFVRWAMLASKVTVP